MWSPLLNLPLTFFIPAANKLLPFFKAFLAPSSIINTPFGDMELIIHFFLASSLETFEINKVQLFSLIILSIGFKYKPLAIIISHPDS